MKRNLTYLRALVVLLLPTLVLAATLTLTWTDNSNNETEFRIYRKVNAVVNGVPQTTGSYSQVGTTAANVTTYVDNTPVLGDQYCFEVSAANSAGESSHSNEACAIVGTILGSVAGQTQAQADAALKAIGLVVGNIIMQASSTVAAGLVISQTPAAGTVVAPGSAVDLVISSGPLVTIPLAPSGATLK